MKSSRKARAVAFLTLIAMTCALASGSARQASQMPQPRGSEWGDWVERGFPFFSSVIDAGRAGAGFPAKNLTPRGLVLRIGSDHWVGFDTDLLRVAAIWRGKGVTPKALAPGSYHKADKKTPGGQSELPEPDGKVWLANGIYPGWQTGDRAAFDDPREPAPSPEEVGRGPLTEQQGRFKALRQVRTGVVLEYTAGGADVREHISVSDRNGQWTLVRHFRVGPSSRPLWLMLGEPAQDVQVRMIPETLVLGRLAGAGGGGAKLASRTVHVPAHAGTLEFAAEFTNGPAFAAASPAGIPSDLPSPRWRQEITTSVTRSSAKDAYVVDDIQLPTDNPWRRSVRASDIQFMKDGTGVLVTLDGDVWFVRGLNESAGTVRWRRFASGLHEPLSLAIRDEQVYVFDRNGIWRLRDTNGDGEADVHEMFSNAFAQTADNREFPSTLRLGPRGEFVIAKGGQEATTIGKHNGSVLRLSADGRQATVLGYGLRQPQLSVNIRTGVVIASDQQGHYIPSTPLHIVRDRQFYGFLSDKLPREVYPAPIADPIMWIPHATNASAMSQVWLFDAKMGPLNDGLVHIGYNNPELFRVLLNNRASRPQGAVVSVTRAFDYPPLNGSVNPADGQLYIAGFQIIGWGTTATRLSGLGRVRYTGAESPLPSDVVAMDKGILVRFDAPLDAAKAVNPDNYSVTSWKYKRTYQYGSPQFKADGTPGIDRLAPSHAYLSKDGRSVFIGVPDMKPVMQMRLGWSLATARGAAFENSAYFTPYELPVFDPVAEGFGSLTVDLSPRAVAATTTAAVTVEEGRRVSQLYGCIACHSTEESNVTMLGPTWKGLYGSERSYARGTQKARADDAYLREAILEPAAKLATGYERGEAGMPSYAGVLSQAQLDAIVLYIKSLR
jgi:glucose/arabinose dehydrogenase/mono/diheme cytochrome c family protein